MCLDVGLVVQSRFAPTNLGEKTWVSLRTLMCVCVCMLFVQPHPHLYTHMCIYIYVYMYVCVSQLTLKAIPTHRAVI